MWEIGQNKFPDPCKENLDPVWCLNNNYMRLILFVWLIFGFKYNFCLYFVHNHLYNMHDEVGTVIVTVSTSW